jgi:hypothetical protein
LHLGYHGNGRHFEFFQPPKAATHYGVSMATAANFVQQIPICLAYLVSLDVDVVPIKFHQFLFGK